MLGRSLRPPERLDRRELTILALFALVALTQGWAGTVITHALPFAQDDFGWSDAQVFDALAIVRAVSLSALALSWFADRHGRRRPLLVAFVLLPVANLATALLADPGSFVGFQSIARIGTLTIGSLAVVVLAEEMKPTVRSYAIAVYALLGSMGTGLGLLLRPLGEGAPEDWRWLFVISALPLAVTPLLVRRIGESRAYVRPAQRPGLAAVLRAPHRRYFWPLAAMSFAVSAFTAPAANLVLVRLENQLGWSAATASIMLAATSAPGVSLGLLVGGRMADVVGRRPTEFVSMLVGVAGGVSFYFLDSGPLMGVAIFVSILGAFGFAPAFGSHRSELFPTEIRSTASAWTVNASVLGGLTGFAAGRFVVDAWGIPVTMAALGAVVLAATSLILLLPETKGLHLTEPSTETEPPTGAIPA